MIANFDTAVEVLDDYVQSKTNHNVKALMARMAAICNEAHWVSMEEQNEFAQICRNFEIYVEKTGKTSIGRKQFEAWWENNDIEMAEEAPGLKAVKTADDYVRLADIDEDPLDDDLFGIPGTIDRALKNIEEHGETVDNSKEAVDLKQENHRLRKRVDELEKAVARYERERKQIREMVMWGLNN